MSLPDKDANCIGTTSDGEMCVLGVRDSANFYSHHDSCAFRRLCLTDWVQPPRFAAIGWRLVTVIKGSLATASFCGSEEPDGRGYYRLMTHDGVRIKVRV